MRKEKTKIIPEQTRTVIDYVECDICGKRTGKGTHEGMTKWNKSTYEVNEVTVQTNTGSSFPEGGSGEFKYFDICDDCFEQHLVPFMESIGAKVQTKEWDF